MRAKVFFNDCHQNEFEKNFNTAIVNRLIDKKEYDYYYTIPCQLAGYFFLANELEIMYSTVEKLYNKRYGRRGNVFFV